jgi:hypothetical protein
MVACAYCEHTLTCDSCQAEYVPPSQEHYEALSRPDVVVLCPVCEQVLVCRWCKTPYDGSADDDDEPGKTG